MTPRNKAEWRTMLLAARAALPETVRAAEAEALAAAVAGISAEVICGYVPFGSEPGSTAMLDALVEAGARVLLPVVTGIGPLSWADYTGAADLVSGRYGIPTPAGPRLPPETIAVAELVLVPALAVDRRGVRLGRGAGYYDRSLGAVDPAAGLIAVVRDAELVDELPEEPHDRRLGWALTPELGLAALVGGAVK